MGALRFPSCSIIHIYIFISLISYIYRQEMRYGWRQWYHSGTLLWVLAALDIYSTKTLLVTHSSSELPWKFASEDCLKSCLGRLPLPH